MEMGKNQSRFRIASPFATTLYIPHPDIAIAIAIPIPAMSQEAAATGRAHRRMRVSPPSDGRSTAPRVGDPHAEYRAIRSRKIVREFAVFVVALSTVACVAFIVFWSLGVLGEVDWEEEATNVAFPDTLKQWNALIQPSASSKIKNRSVVLVVYSDGCPSCKRMKAPFVQTARRMVDYPVDFVAVNANKGVFGPLFLKYGVEMVPTILFLNPKRNIFPYHGGPHANKIQEFITTNLANATKH